ncbi:RYamide receptor [Eurytemora carolleeae]|uniref:RYamide receptor n=1 Tax=Eurytemora carolleeae TaxID=1294199 RepID=UPI000C7691F6|nr:RYamide receptor [Eurytemora carolleeae]|eukprot:XP_023322083.1 RYamide receptor-like [Eurytemora affinis]
MQMETSNLSEQFNNSFTEGDNTTSQLIELNEKFKICAGVMYGIIFVLGSIGNFMFTYIVISTQSTAHQNEAEDMFGWNAIKSVTNYFLVNLSVADFLISFTCIPIQVTILFLGYYPYGKGTCLLFSFIQPTAVCASSFTLVIVSLDRYMTIMHPLRQRMKKPKGVLCIIWLISGVVSIPDVVMIQYTETGPGRYQCHKPNIMPAFDVVMLVFVYILPVLVMLYTYSMMALTIWRKREIGEVQSSQLVTRKNQMLRSKKKMVKMLIVVVSLYTVCYFPINILWLVLSQLNLSQAQFAYIFTLFHCFALFHTIFNPIIYFWMNRKIRQRFLFISFFLDQTTISLYIIVSR